MAKRKKQPPEHECPKYMPTLEEITRMKAEIRAANNARKAARGADYRDKEPAIREVSPDRRDGLVVRKSIGKG